MLFSGGSTQSCLLIPRGAHGPCGYGSLPQGQTLGARVLAASNKLAERSAKAPEKSRLYEEVHHPENNPPGWFFFQKILMPKQNALGGHLRGKGLWSSAWGSQCLGRLAECSLPRLQGYLARPVTTVWAQGAMISLKLPWSKNPLCQDPFRAADRRTEAQAKGWG